MRIDKKVVARGKSWGIRTIEQAIERVFLIALPLTALAKGATTTSNMIASELVQILYERRKWYTNRPAQNGITHNQEMNRVLLSCLTRETPLLYIIFYQSPIAPIAFVCGELGTLLRNSGGRPGVVWGVGESWGISPGARSSLHR